MPQVPDITWVELAPSMWLDLETSVAILCACLPVMRPLLHPHRFWHMNRTHSATGVTATTAEGDYTEMPERGSAKKTSASEHSQDGSGSGAVMSASESGLEEGKFAH